MPPEIKTPQDIVEGFRNGPMGFSEYLDAVQDLHKNHVLRLNTYLDDMDARLRSILGLVGKSLEQLEKMIKADSH
jgi:hypothetical protein